jgi:hypothetical protein
MPSLRTPADICQVSGGGAKIAGILYAGHHPGNEKTAEKPERLVKHNGARRVRSEGRFCGAIEVVHGSILVRKRYVWVVIA